jgi:MFS family permease
MINATGSFSALFLAVFLFLTGNGLFNTLLSTRMAVEDFSMATIGSIMTCYFTGLLVGTFMCHRLIQRVGHIRAFAIFAASTTAAALLHGIYVAPLFWGTLRLLGGMTTIGLFMVIESWLNECTTPHLRGRIFSIYMTLSYLGIGTGQQLLNLSDIRGTELFILAGIIFSLCLIPVSATESVHPTLPDRKMLKFIAIFKKAPLGMLGCMSAGLTNSAFFALTPALCESIGLTLQQLSLIMSITVFAGLMAQWIIGMLSDRFDRTLVLSVIVTSIAVVTGFMFIKAGTSFFSMAIEMGVLGSLIFAVYPVAVARAHDVYDGKDTVAVSAGLLFAYSVGASISPVLASFVITMLNNPFGLFAFWCVIHCLFILFIMVLRKQEKVEIVPIGEQVDFVPMESTSPVVSVMDPRRTIHDTDKQEPDDSEKAVTIRFHTEIY